MHNETLTYNGVGNKLNLFSLGVIMKIILSHDQLKEWLKTAQFIASTEEYLDDGGNLEGQRTILKHIRT